jgi:hypothetical protein
VAGVLEVKQWDLAKKKPEKIFNKNLETKKTFCTFAVPFNGKLAASSGKSW